MDVTNDQRQALGLNIADTTPTQIDPPTTAPYVRVTGVKSGEIFFELRQNDDLRASRRTSPMRIVFTYAGDARPTSINQWNYAMTTGRTNLSMPFPEGAGGQTLWITAFWTNAKGQSGPSSEPVSVNLPAISARPSQIDQHSNPPLRRECLTTRNKEPPRERGLAGRLASCHGFDDQ